jgi:hypothetical protein
MENQNDFEKGLDSGLSQIPRDDYQAYLSETVEYNYLKQNRNVVLDKISQKKKSIDLYKEQYISSLADEKQIMLEFGELAYKKDFSDSIIKSNQEKIAEIETEKKKFHTPYPFLAGFIYLLAGITFIVGDLIISHEIVAYALNIKNNVHAWAFAFGLASVSILLKPAYDRLIEQPYLKNENASSRKLHGIFQGVLVFTAVATLGILGYFRYESYRVSELKKGINQEIKSLKSDNISLMPGQVDNANSALNSQIDAKLKAFNDLNVSLVNSKWALLSFIMSGILFAIAGAICLGIAFPSLQIYWQRWFGFNWKIFTLKNGISKHRRKLNKILKPYFVQKAQIEFINKKNEFFPSIATLESEIEHLEKELSEINLKIKNADENLRINIFGDGYQTGDISAKTMTDEELEELRKIQLERLRNLRNDKVKSAGLRPHLALRKAIQEKY